jgi:hypothetical protein
VRRGHQGVHGTARQHTDKNRATAPGRPQDRQEIGRACFERGKVDIPTREPNAAVIVGDDAGKGRQLAEERSDEGILPLPVDVSGPMGLPDDVDRPVAVDPVRDVRAVLWAGVTERRPRPHARMLAHGRRSRKRRSRHRRVSVRDGTDTQPDGGMRSSPRGQSGPNRRRFLGACDEHVDEAGRCRPFCWLCMVLRSYPRRTMRRSR